MVPTTNIHEKLMTGAVSFTMVGALRVSIYVSFSIQESQLYSLACPGGQQMYWTWNALSSPRTQAANPAFASDRQNDPSSQAQ